MKNPLVDLDKIIVELMLMSISLQERLAAVTTSLVSYKNSLLGEVSDLQAKLADALSKPIATQETIDAANKAAADALDKYNSEVSAFEAYKVTVSTEQTQEEASVIALEGLVSPVVTPPAV